MAPLQSFLETKEKKTKKKEKKRKKNKKKEKKGKKTKKKRPRNQPWVALEIFWARLVDSVDRRVCLS